MLAERWKITDGGRTWKFQLRKGVHFHDGRELTAEDVKFTFSSIAREGSANSLSTEFRLIKSMEIESRYAITIHFDKPSVVFANKVNQGLFASVAFIQSKSSIESAGEEGAERRPIGTGPWKFVEHVRGDRIVYEAVEGHWRATPNFKRLVMLKVPEPARKARPGPDPGGRQDRGLAAGDGHPGKRARSLARLPKRPLEDGAAEEAEPLQPAPAKALLGEAGYPKGFDVTMNLTAWPGR